MAATSTLLNYIGGTVQVPVKHWDRRTSPKVLVDADTLIYRVKPPVGALQIFTLGTSAEVAHDGTGLYRLYFVPAEDDVHEVTILTTYGGVQGVVQLSFKVEPANTPSA